MKTLNNISKLLQKNFAVFTIVIALVAYFFPNVFLWSNPHMSLLMGLVMFGMSLTMEIQDFKQLVMKPKAMIVGLSCVFIASSIVTIILVNALHLPVALKIGILMCAAVPGGNITNVLTFIGKGDTPLSVGLTSVGTLIAPIVTPAMCLILVRAWTDVDGPGMIKTMIISVIIPLLIGLAMKAWLKTIASKLEEFSPTISLVSLSIMTGGLIAGRKAALMGLDWRIFVTVLCFLILSTSAAYGISRLFRINQYQRRAVAIEAGFKNTVLAAMLAGVSFKNYPESALVGIIAAVMAAVLGSIFANVMAKMPITDGSGKEEIESSEA
ncbi:MAG: bile acid:sodium symporter family protein [Clostridioides sp.]|jgi:BASS family bile acid:Na+ symporter|nr:bile acid:sodium symporter family protein [Clostridioides sp.]